MYNINYQSLLKYNDEDFLSLIRSFVLESYEKEIQIGKENPIIALVQFYNEIDSLFIRYQLRKAFLKFVKTLDPSSVYEYRLFLSCLDVIVAIKPEDAPEYLEDCIFKYYDVFESDNQKVEFSIKIFNSLSDLSVFNDVIQRKFVDFISLHLNEKIFLISLRICLKNDFFLFQILIQKLIQSDFLKDRKFVKKLIMQIYYERELFPIKQFESWLSLDMYTRFVSFYNNLNLFFDAILEAYDLIETPNLRNEEKYLLNKIRILRHGNIPPKAWFDAVDDNILYGKKVCQEKLYDIAQLSKFRQQTFRPYYEIACYENNDNVYLKSNNDIYTFQMTGNEAQLDVMIEFVNSDFGSSKHSYA